jgi:hypothetical protein
VRESGFFSYTASAGTHTRKPGKVSGDTEQRHHNFTFALFVLSRGVKHIFLAVKRRPITICSIKRNENFFSLVFFRVLKRAVLSRVHRVEGGHERHENKKTVEKSFFFYRT